VVRVSHASVGVTDLMASRGDYLLQPRPGFVTGYDLVGRIERLPVGGEAQGLEVGRRVAAVLPRMGGHATRVALPASLLVPLPDDLDDALAATFPLDAVTALAALELLDPQAADPVLVRPDPVQADPVLVQADPVLVQADPVLVQGAGGAVGALAVQLIGLRGGAAYGTASDRSRAVAERHGAVVLDHRDPDWIEELRDRTGGGVAGLIDHTGSAAVRRAVRPGGRLVRTAFGGAPGRQRRATALGSLRALTRRYANPAERICSVPMLVAADRPRYRRMLGELLRLLAAGTLRSATPVPVPFADFPEALRAAGSARPGTKIVLAMPT